MADLAAARARQALLVTCPVCAAPPREVCRRLISKKTEAPLQGPHTQRCVEASIRFRLDDELALRRRLRRR